MEKGRAEKGLRKGFTTGTSAAASALAAATFLFTGKRPRSVVVRLPGGSSLAIPVKRVSAGADGARAVVIKDAGDDPDATNGAEIVATVSLMERKTASGRPRISIAGGEGVGRVTKPGLAVTPGRPAINPVPLKMIRGALRSFFVEAKIAPSVKVVVSVPRGVEIAKKTMNARLGILGGISILGTTGIVEPLSLRAYTDSIRCAISVAVAGGLHGVVFSTGRSSEKAIEKFMALPETAFVLTGDHMGFALDEAARRKEIKHVTLAGQFGKFTKLAAGHFETHCADSSVDMEFLKNLARGEGAGEALLEKIGNANTAREVFFMLKASGLDGAIEKVSLLVRQNASHYFPRGVNVRAVLVGYDHNVEATAK